MTDETTTLSYEDPLTLECTDTQDSEIDSDSEPDQNFDDYFWPTDDQVAEWDAEASTWRNSDVYGVAETAYDGSGEV
jgi:hypothetical protein